MSNRRKRAPFNTPAGAVGGTAPGGRGPVETVVLIGRNGNPGWSRGQSAKGNAGPWSGGTRDTAGTASAYVVADDAKRPKVSAVRKTDAARVAEARRAEARRVATRKRQASKRAKGKPSGVPVADAGLKAYEARLASSPTDNGGGRVPVKRAPVKRHRETALEVRGNGALPLATKLDYLIAQLALVRHGDGAAMRDEAIAAWESLRSEYRAATSRVGGSAGITTTGRLVVRVLVSPELRSAVDAVRLPKVPDRGERWEAVRFQRAAGCFLPVMVGSGEVPAEPLSSHVTTVVVADDDTTVTAPATPTVAGCQATTRTGTPCTRPARVTLTDDTHVCTQHSRVKGAAPVATPA